MATYRMTEDGFVMGRYYRAGDDLELTAAQARYLGHVEEVRARRRSAPRESSAARSRAEQSSAARSRAEPDDLADAPDELDGLSAARSRAEPDDLADAPAGPAVAPAGPAVAPSDAADVPDGRAAGARPRRRKGA